MPLIVRSGNVPPVNVAASERARPARASPFLGRARLFPLKLRGPFDTVRPGFFFEGPLMRILAFVLAAFLTLPARREELSGRIRSVHPGRASPFLGPARLCPLKLRGPFDTVRPGFCVEGPLMRILAFVLAAFLTLPARREELSGRIRSVDLGGEGTEVPA